MAKLIEQKKYILTLNQNELNILYRIISESDLIDGEEAVQDIVCDMADAIINCVTDIEDEDDIPF